MSKFKLLREEIVETQIGAIMYKEYENPRYTFDDMASEMGESYAIYLQTKNIASKIDPYATAGSLIKNKMVESK